MNNSNLSNSNSSNFQRVGQRVQLESIETFFGMQEEQNIRLIPLCELQDFREHPYKVIEDESLLELSKSILENGLFEPIVVREIRTEEYEIISGHRRKRACELAGLIEANVIILDMDDDSAVIRMVDSNLYREKILPSEKAFAYKMKLEAMKKQCENTLSKSEQMQDTRKELSNQTGESETKLSRYIRLTYLIKPLLDLVDNGTLKVGVGACLSFLDDEKQACIFDLYEKQNYLPSLRQAEEIKKHGKEETLTDSILNQILHTHEKKKTQKINLPYAKLEKYFSEDESEEEIIEQILNLLDRFTNNSDLDETE